MVTLMDMASPPFGGISQPPTYWHTVMQRPRTPLPPSQERHLSRRTPLFYTIRLFLSIISNLESPQEPRSWGLSISNQKSTAPQS